MTEIHILDIDEANALCRELEAEREAPPPCCCQNGGEPYELEPGVWVTSRNAGCRRHQPAPAVNPAAARTAVAVRRGRPYSTRPTAAYL